MNERPAADEGGKRAAQKFDHSKDLRMGRAYNIYTKFTQESHTIDRFLVGCYKMQILLPFYNILADCFRLFPKIGR
jgi:hypothetical protein